MSLVSQLDYISEQDYLAEEKLRDIRHEYVNGQVFAVAGSSKRHNRIAGNLYRLFAAERSDYEVYLSDIKVRLQQRKTFYYPDVIISCEDDTGNEYYLESPCLIAEVLSHSTWQNDYQDKLLAYQTIPTLQTYLVISQYEMNVDCFYKDKNGSWWVKHLHQLDDVLKLAYPQINLTLEDIYNRVNFSVDSAKENNNGQ